VKLNERAHNHAQSLIEQQKVVLDESEDENNKGRYKFPYGDFENVHRCGVLAAESRAGQYKYVDIEQAAAHLHGMLEGLAVDEPARS
jgi:hypothetical protein